MVDRFLSRKVFTEEKRRLLRKLFAVGGQSVDFGWMFSHRIIIMHAWLAPSLNVIKDNLARIMFLRKLSGNHSCSFSLFGFLGIFLALRITESCMGVVCSGFLQLLFCSSLLCFGNCTLTGYRRGVVPVDSVYKVLMDIVCC